MSQLCVCTYHCMLLNEFSSRNFTCHAILWLYVLPGRCADSHADDNWSRLKLAQPVLKAFVAVQGGCNSFWAAMCIQDPGGSTCFGDFALKRDFALQFLL